MKNTETEQKKSAPQQEDVKGKPAEKNTSQRATEEAKKGPPLNAERPRDRSPKQENL